MLLNIPYKIIFLFAICFYSLNIKAQGLLFKSNDSLLTKRTSFHVFNDDVPVFQDRFFISFDLSLWDNANLGYVFNISDKDNSYSLSYLFNNGAGSLNFNIDSKSNKIKFLLQPSLLKREKWMKVKVDFNLTADRVTVYINNIGYTADHLGFKGQMPANIIFGKNQHYVEVPNMAIKNLTIADGSKTYTFPLDEWNGNIVHDGDGKATGMVENPVWLINESYFWKPVYQKAFTDVAGLNFNPIDQSIFIFSKDTLTTYNPESKSVTASPYKNPLPVPMVLGKSIFNITENKLYLYELFDVPKGMSSVASLKMDKNNLAWQAIGKTSLPTQLHHHNIFYDVKKDAFYLFGGYGSYNYHNKFLKYDSVADKWEQVTFTGDKITPRFFAATGYSNKQDELYLFGGYGNESGNQIVGGKQYYDFYRINLKDHTIKKCWEIHPDKEVFVPANNLITSKDDKYFYALCYPHEIAKTELRLYKFSIKDGSHEVVSAPIPVTSERIESDDNLFFSSKTDEFFCTTQEFTDRKKSVIKVFSLRAPPVSNSSYLKSLQPQKKSNNALLYIALTLTAALIAGVLVMIYRRKPESNAIETPAETELITERTDTETKKNTVHLLGEFVVFDKNGKDITYLFSPKIKQLFILILLNNSKGITSKKISTTLWPDKDVNKTKNIKGVTFNHLRNIIADINGIELIFLNDTYTFNISEDFFCDYFFLSDFIKEVNSSNSGSVLDHFNLILRGSLLKDMPEPWLDDFKNSYEEQLIALIIPELKKQYDLRELKHALEISKLVLSIDPFNDDAIKYELKSYKRLKGIEHAHKVYDQFTEDYRRSLGVDYPLSFEKIVQ